MLAPVPSSDAVPERLAKLGQFFSVALRLGVFYSLLYVVVEGYKELGCNDDTVDALLAQNHYVDGPGRFRNATFHFQEHPIPPPPSICGVLGSLKVKKLKFDGFFLIDYFRTILVSNRKEGSENLSFLIKKIN